MMDPVVAADGITYERRAIEDYISKERQARRPLKSPVTHQLLTSTMLFRNLVCLAQIRLRFERLWTGDDSVTYILPFDFVFQDLVLRRVVLSLLTPSCVLTLRCVSKRFRDIIDEPATLGELFARFFSANQRAKSLQRNGYVRSLWSMFVKEEKKCRSRFRKPAEVLFGLSLTGAKR
eukprot:TRINITY_DN1653_c0_g2_i1.p1 TRINITY_DN1653_c0_g2~~TRINITY_DN1653_c0_g2_i1.p1  ORF type:complete len:205 (+),score=38.24 TRINITY_DN1653_c0_g2_i1:85-615(+)